MAPPHRRGDTAHLTAPGTALRLIPPRVSAAGQLTRESRLRPPTATSGRSPAAPDGPRRASGGCARPVGRGGACPVDCGAVRIGTAEGRFSTDRAAFPRPHPGDFLVV